MLTPPLTVEELENRLLSLHRATIELVKEISIDTVLEKMPGSRLSGFWTKMEIWKNSSRSE
jgi:hypothetical protein